jgi:hypothetical protein
MTDQGLSFHEGAAPSGHVNCSRCGASVTEYWAVDGAVLCEPCKGEVLAARGSSDGRGGRIAKAFALGTAGALVGAAVWYAVAKFAHIELALIAILLAFLVGKGVFIGSGKRGGLGYQLMALALTWFGIGAAAAPFAFEGFTQHAAQVADSLRTRDTTTAAPAAMSDSQIQAELAKLDSAIAKPPAPKAASGWGVVLLGLGALVLLILSLPVLVVVNSGSFILVIIYGVGLFEAWKLTRRVEALVSGPHAVGMH